MKKIVLILSVFCTIVSYAQTERGNNSTRGIFETSDDEPEYDNMLFLKKRMAVPKNSIVFNFGYSFPTIRNDLMNKSDLGDKKSGSGIEFGVDFRKQFRTRAIVDDDLVLIPTWFAVGVGLGVNIIKKSDGFESYSDILSNYEDIDGDNCTVNMVFNNVKESVSLTYLDIPLYLEIGKPSRIKISPYLKLGLKASYNISDNSSGSRTYKSTGVYSKWNVTLHDIPELGYYTDKTSEDKPEYKLSPFVLWGTISAGINFPLRSRDRLASWIIRLGAKVDYSLTSISKAVPEAANETDYINSRLNQSFLLGGDNSKIFSYGMSVGLIYCY